MIYALGEMIPDVEPTAWVAPGASVVGNVGLGAHSSIWFGAVLRGDEDRIEIGPRSNVQDGAVLHADPGFPCMVGPGVTIGHQAMVHGCTVGAGSLIGIHAVILNGAVIGPDCLIGANALVGAGKVIPAGSLVLGSPGRVVRPLGRAQLEEIHEAAAIYVEKAQRMRRGLRAITQ